MLFCLLMSWAALAIAAPIGLSGDVALEAGWDSNLNNASSAEDKVGAALLRASASFGVAHLRSRWSIRAGLGAGYGAWVGFSDLSGGTGRLYVSAAWEPASWVAVSVSPSLGGALYGDPGRNNWNVGASGRVRFRPVQAVAILVGYGFTHVDTAQDVFDNDRHRMSASLEVRPARRTWISTGYDGTFGQTVRYVEADSASAVARVGGDSGSGSGTGDRKQVITQANDTFAPGEVATRVPATAHTYWVEVDQQLVDWVELQVTFSHTWVFTEPSPYTAMSVGGGVVFRFP
jgi:hypothetical protein